MSDDIRDCIVDCLLSVTHPGADVFLKRLVLPEADKQPGCAN